MKYAYIAAATLGLFLTAPAIHAIADDQTPPSEMDHQDGDHGDWDEGKMKAKLGLSDDQAAKLKALRASSKEAFKPVMEKDRGLMAKLNDQVVNKAADSDIEATLKDLKANRNAMKEQMEKMQDQKDAILTPMQRAKMLLARHAMMKHGREKHEGMNHDHAADAPH